MSNAMSPDEARAAARARWGTSRIDRMLDELAERTDEMGPPQVAALARVTARAASHTAASPQRSETP